MTTPTPTPTVPCTAEIHDAARRLRTQLRRTPTLELTPADLASAPAGLGGRLVLKLELLQHTGVFKARGALNALLNAGDEGRLPRDGVVAASGGNHGAAVAWAARDVGVPATIFVPSTSPQSKVSRIASYGAQVNVVDGRYPQARAALEEWVMGRDVLDIHAYDRREVVVGQGSLGVEVAEQVPDVTRVLVSCGGGGLYAGTTLALDGRAPVQPVEPTRCPTLTKAVDAGEPVRVDVDGVAADSMGAGIAGTIAHAVAATRSVRPLLVDDDAITAARWFLWDRCRVLAEPGGATALAAVLSGATPVADGGTLVVVVSGGNHDEVPPPS